MIVFRCKRSGNTVSFENENDIAQMRKHEGYEEVVEETSAAEPETTQQKKRGRPARQKD